MDNFSKILEQMQQGNKDDLANKKNTENVRQLRNFSAFCYFVVILHKGIKSVEIGKSQ
jgi:hypothetical protein